MVSDFLYRRWKCHFLAPQNGHFCQKCPSWDLKKRHFQCRYKKSETTVIIQTFPKTEDYSLWFHLLSLFRVGLDDFHFRALLALISEGKSDQNEKCNFAKEGVLRSKNWRKQTHLKIKFYIEKHVWQKVLGNLSDIIVSSPSPNTYFIICFLWFLKCTSERGEKGCFLLGEHDNSSFGTKCCPRRLHSVLDQHN